MFFFSLTVMSVVFLLCCFKNGMILFYSQVCGVSTVIGVLIYVYLLSVIQFRMVTCKRLCFSVACNFHSLGKVDTVSVSAGQRVFVVCFRRRGTVEKWLTRRQKCRRNQILAGFLKSAHHFIKMLPGDVECSRQVRGYGWATDGPPALGEGLKSVTVSFFFFSNIFMKSFIYG